VGAGFVGTIEDITDRLSRQTKALAALSAVTPDWANRLVVSRMTR